MEKIQKKLNGKNIEVSFPNFGLGIMRTSTAYVALIVSLEGHRTSRIDVLDSVMESLGIYPEEIIHNRKRPDTAHEEARREWEVEKKSLLKKLGIKE